TPELEFIVRHWREADTIHDDASARYGEDIQDLVSKVYDRACEDAELLLTLVGDHIARAVEKYARINWRQGNIQKHWYMLGDVLRPNGRGGNVGWVDVYLDAETRHCPRIVLSVWPKGGKSGSQFFVAKCRAKWPTVQIPTSEKG